MRVINVLRTTTVAFLVCLGQAAWAGDALDSWTASNSGSPTDLHAAAFGQGTFVAVGGNGTIVTSTDGLSWVARSSGISATLRCVAYGNTGFVAGGGDLGGAILTSPDGLRWTQVGGASIPALMAVTHAAADYVAVGGVGPNGGVILTSTDGVAWSTRVSSATHPSLPPQFNGVAYGNGRFVAISVGAQGTVAISTNAVEWTFIYALGPLYAEQLAFGNGTFVAVGAYVTRDPVTRVLVSRGVAYSSVDGITWTQRQDIPGAYNSVTYAAGIFIAVGGPTGSSIGAMSTSTSTDGTNWTQRAVTSGGLGVAYGNNQFVTVGTGGAIFRSAVVGRLGARLSNAQFLGTINGVTGQDYEVQLSSNLTDWTALTNVTISDGTGQFSDPILGGSGRRFYRATINVQ